MSKAPQKAAPALPPETSASDTTAERAGNQPPSRSVVTVGCKMPNGLHLRVFRAETFQEPVQGGGYRDTVRQVPVEEVVLFGTARRIGEDARCMVYDGYALTPNVDAGFMRAWMQQNANLDVVKQRLVIVNESEMEVRAEAKELTALRHGMEPLNPDPRKDPRIPKSRNPNLTAIEPVPASERPAA